MTDTAKPQGDAELYHLWAHAFPDNPDRVVPVDEGAALWVGRYLVDLCGEDRWRDEAEKLVARIRAVLQAGESDLDDVTARRRAALVAQQSVLVAVDEQRYRQGKAAPASKGQSNGQTPIETLQAAARRVLETAQNPPEAIPTIFPGLNKLLLGGFRRGELIYLGARPSVGKSSLAGQIALAIGQRAHGTLIVSCEMSTESVARRMISQAGRLDAAALRSGRGINFEAVKAAAEKVEQYPIWITDKAATLEQIGAVVAQVGDKLRLLIVDYLQLLAGPRQIKDRRLQVEAISAALKRLAVKRSIAVLALSSLSRPAAGGERRPSLGSLRESGMLEHDADIVLLLHREKDGAETECLVAKNRDGRTGTVKLMFRPDWVGFDEVTNELPTDEWEARYGGDWQD